MATVRIEFSPIREAFLHGYRASDGYHRVEVVRCYAGQWAVFKYRFGAQLRDPDARDMVYASAMKHAREWMAAQA